MVFATLLFLLMGLPVFALGVWVYSTHKDSNLRVLGIGIILMSALPALLWLLILTIGAVYFN